MRKIISYLPEEEGAYKNLTGREYLNCMAKFFGHGAKFQGMVRRGLEIANLGERMIKSIDTARG